MKKVYTIVIDAIKLIFKDLWELKWLILIFGAYVGTVKLGLHRFCPLVQIVGFPCPGCGVTRGCVSILLGRFNSAFIFNPTSFMWVSFFIYCGIFRYFFKMKPPKMVALFFAILTIMVIVYIFKLTHVFPGEAPFEFNEKNTLGHFFPGYNEFVLNHIY